MSHCSRSRTGYIVRYHLLLLVHKRRRTTLKSPHPGLLPTDQSRRRRMLEASSYETNSFNPPFRAACCACPRRTLSRNSPDTPWSIPARQARPKGPERGMARAARRRRHSFSGPRPACHGVRGTRGRPSWVSLNRSTVRPPALAPRVHGQLLDAAVLALRDFAKTKQGDPTIRRISCRAKPADAIAAGRLSASA